MSFVSFVRVTHKNYNELRKAIEKSLTWINFNIDKSVKKIVIKPNMCYYYHPSTGDVTDPWFVSVLIDVLRGKFADGPEIFVVESDASAMKCKYAFKMLGYDKMAKTKNVKLINLTEVKSKVVNIKVDGAKFKFCVPELFYDADLIVNVPKIKYMSQVKITCALKNMFGCNAFSRKYVYHKALNEAIVGINKLIRTDLVVVDGLVVNGKYVKRLGLVMASTDPVAIDTAASTLMGIKPTSVKQIVLASMKGLGTMHFDPVGDFSYFMREFPRKSITDDLRETLVSYYLKIFNKELDA